MSRHGDDDAITLHEEQLRVGMTTEESGRVRAVKRVDTDHVESRVARGVEHADVSREQPVDGDSGQVETLEDGSLSIPVFEEQIFIEKRMVVRERVIVRKQTVYEDHVVQADLKRERLEFETEGNVRLAADSADPTVDRLPAEGTPGDRIHGDGR